MKEPSFIEEVKKGQRFPFGKNWAAFLQTLTEERIHIAGESLKSFFSCEDFKGKSFLDVGCGSGLFSLAAMRSNAETVHSFDFDPDSVGCTKSLRQKYFPVSSWRVQEGSVLERTYLDSFGLFDIVYSWGVLHHTGNLAKAMDNISNTVKENGKLFIAIYNDQGSNSVRWRRVKKMYNSGQTGKIIITSFYIPYFVVRGLLGDLKRWRNPFKRYREYKKNRGMSVLHDWHDWLGGLPFEVAKPEKVVAYFESRGFRTIKTVITSSAGCNEFLFEKK